MNGDRWAWRRGEAWKIATAAGRDYITPEDVGDALASGADPHIVARDVLEAIEVGSVEDASLCAFVWLDRFEALVRAAALAAEVDPP